MLSIMALAPLPTESVKQVVGFLFACFLFFIFLFSLIYYCNFPSLLSTESLSTSPSPNYFSISLQKWAGLTRISIERGITSYRKTRHLPNIRADSAEKGSQKQAKESETIHDETA